MINEETFASRLTSLREQKKVSAREMSLDLGEYPKVCVNLQTDVR